MSKVGRRITKVALAATLVVGLLGPATASAEDPADLPGPRIIGGAEVNPPGKYGFMVALVDAGEANARTGHFCGGSLVSTTWVLTAAHCITNSAGAFDRAPDDVDVVIARHDLTTGSGERINGDLFLKHPDWDGDAGGTFDNDVALIRLDSAATLGAIIPLATSADAGLWDPGDTTTVMGWGTTDPSFPPFVLPDELQEVDIPIVADATCTSAWGAPFYFPGLMICGGDDSVDACVGDSGGPLVAPPGAGPWTQIGIVSAGPSPCAQAALPGIYTEVAAFEAWISSVVTNTPPTGDDQSATTNVGVPLPVTMTGSDGDGDSLTFSIDTGPSNGTLGAITPVSATSAEVTYTPNGGYFGPDSFVFQVDDGKGGTDTATVSITVNRPPTGDDQSPTTDEDVPLVVTMTGTDPDGDPLTFSIDTGPAKGTLGAITPVSPTSADVTYTPNPNVNGADSFVFQVDDGNGGTDTATVSITVDPVPDPPVADDQSRSLPEDGPTIITLTGSDPDGDPLTFSIDTNPANGTLSPITPLNATSARVTYTSHLNYNGPDSFVFQVDDGNGGTDTAAVSITVDPVNDVPVGINDGPFALDEGGSFTLSPQSVLDNDVDVENDPLTAVKLLDPTHGSVTLNSNGTFTYVHDGSENFTDSFAYRPDDGSPQIAALTLVQFAINPIDDPPVVVPDSATALEGGGVTIGVGGNDFDPEGAPLTFRVGTQPAHGTVTKVGVGTFRYQHDGSETTSDSFTYIANDGGLDSVPATVSITITPVNDPPIAVNDSATVAEGGTVTINVAVNDSDAENDPLTFALVLAPKNGTVTKLSEGVFRYVHNGSETTSDAFTYIAGDGLLNSAPATVSITVTPVNDPPIAGDDTLTVLRGGIGGITVGGNDFDPEGSPLTFALASAPIHGTVVETIDGTFVYTHDGSAASTDSFTYVANDGALNSAPATVRITIDAVAPPPPPIPSPIGEHVGLFDPTQGRWHLRRTGGALESFFFGNPVDVPFMGDWDCDGIDTPGLYRQSDGFVYLRNSNTVGIADVRFFFGNPGDVPIAGDFNGNGCDTVSIYRPSTQQFFIINRLGSGASGLGAADMTFTFGNPGDQPFAGDLDADGLDEVGLHRASTGLVYYRLTLGPGAADRTFIFGDPLDRFVAGDWSGDGMDTVGVFRPSLTSFLLRNANSAGFADATIPFGQQEWLPVAGRFFP